MVVGLDSPDDAAVVDTGGPRLAVHTVDYFRAIVDDPYLFGKIAANHALGDIFAMGAEPQSALAIATVPYGLEAKVEADLSAMMAGANEILAEVGLRAGRRPHQRRRGARRSASPSMASSIATASSARAGCKPGDALILTKPIGTGTLLAADMRGKAKARWVMAAIAHMTQLQPSRPPPILRRHGVHAATDVTGFGLLGHLVEMTKAGGVDARLYLDCIPVLEGARETVAAGVFSSLQPQNLRLRRAVRNVAAAAENPLYPLLFDPQTAGGLLAAAPAAQAEACVAALRASGYPHAAVVGDVVAEGSSIEPIDIRSSRPDARSATVSVETTSSRETADV